MANVTKALMASIRPEINAALKELAKKHGILIQLGSGSFSADGLVGSFKLELAAQGEDAQPGETPVHVQARKDWKDQAQYLDLKPEWLGQSFKRNGATCMVLGLMPKRTRFPVFVRQVNPDGTSKEILLTPDEIKVRMGATERAATSK